MARIGLLLLIGTLMIGCSFVSGTADTGNSTETEAETAPESPVAEVVEPTKQATLAPTDPPTDPPVDTTTTTVKTTPTPVKEEVQEEPKQSALGAEKEMQSAEGEGGEEEEVNEPPNEWSTYYSLPSERPTMLDIFNQVFENYVNSANPETECRENDAEFSRWYKSSKNPDHVILSYYCKTKAVRGYEHLKISLDKKNVIEFQDTLKGFSITDAGDYEVKLEGDAATEIREELLPFLIDQIAEQKDDTAAQNEICPDPGTETFATALEKKENGLYYDKITISCNKTATDSGIPSHQTEIEVVTDRDFKLLNDGKPVLVSMDTNPIRNTMYIEKTEQEEEESMKQTDDASSVFAPSFTNFVCLVAMYLLPRLL